VYYANVNVYYSIVNVNVCANVKVSACVSLCECACVKVCVNVSVCKFKVPVEGDSVYLHLVWGPAIYTYIYTCIYEYIRICVYTYIYTYI